MYVFGGFDGLYRNDFHRFNFENNTWTPVRDTQNNPESWPKPRYRTTATVFRDYLVIFGGHDGAR